MKIHTQPGEAAAEATQSDVAKGFKDLPSDIQSRILAAAYEPTLDGQRDLVRTSVVDHSLNQTVRRLMGNRNGAVSKSPIESLKARLVSADNPLTCLDLTDANLGGADLLDLIQTAGRAGTCCAFKLAGNGINDLLSKQIASTLSSAPSLITLDLRNNDWTLKGLAAWVGLIEAHPELKHLDLGANFVGLAGWQLLEPAVRALPNLETLGLQRSALHAGQAEMMEFMAQRPHCKVTISPAPGP